MNARPSEPHSDAQINTDKVAVAEHWKASGYQVEMVYLRLTSAQLALRRVAARVRQGGHNVPRNDVLRRFARGWRNFTTVYRLLASAWAVYDNSGERPIFIEKYP